MTSKRLAAAVLTAGLLLSCHAPSTARERPEPDLVFCRTKATETFEGELDISVGKTKVDSVAVKAGESLAFTITSFDEPTLYFEDLYRSASQTLVITRESEEEEINVGLAVYDNVSLETETGGATLTVVDSKTGAPIPSAAYSLYHEGKRQKELSTNAEGKIVLQGLEPGAYELRPGAAPAGYLPAEEPVPFEISGLVLSGGESRVRTSQGDKHLAADNETFIAGEFSPDVELKGLAEKNIQSITITFENFGAGLGRQGKKTVKSFVTPREAEKYLNYRKARGEICGPVEISYALKEGNLPLTQEFDSEPPPAPTPAPTPAATPRPVATSAPTLRPVQPTQRPVQQPTQRPSQSQTNNNYKGSTTQTAAPISTPVPSVNPITTPNPALGQNLTIACTSDTDRREGFVFEIVGTGSTIFKKEYRTDSQGLIRATVPAGLYTITPKDCPSNKGFALPQPQAAQVAAAGNAYFSFSFLSSERDLVLTVQDNDGLPLEGVLIGIFDPTPPVEAPGDTRTESHTVDISQELSDIREQEAFEERLANPYEKKNALRTAYTDNEGHARIKNAPTTALLAVPLETPQGYTKEAQPTQLPEGTGTEFSVLCEYVEVSLSVLHNDTGQPVTGADARLLDSTGKELAAWVTDGEPKHFIRVPAGSYTLCLAFEGLEDTVSYTVERAPAKQEVTVKTHIQGILSEDEIPADMPWYHTVWALCAYILLGGGALGAGGVCLYKRARKRWGGIL